MPEPIISVVMAAFNVGDPAVLDMAITSILQQDMLEFELLICDDASTDGTYEWLLEWEKHDSRIHLLQNDKNRKAAAARNRCLSIARGKYIAIMDADDACTSNRLSAQVRFLEAHPQFSFVGLRGERFCKKPGDREDSYWFVEEPKKEDFLMTMPFVHGSLMFRRESVMRVDGYDESSKVERSEDYDMLLRMYAKGMLAANSSDAIYYIREDESAMHRRKYRYRWKEAAVKFRGFSSLGLMPKGLLYAIKPLIVGLLPQDVLARMKNLYYGRGTELCK